MMSIGKRKYLSIHDPLSLSPTKKRFLQFIPFNLKPTLVRSDICYLSQIPTEIRDLILLKLSPHELHQLASTSNEYFSIVLNFLRSSMGTQYFKLILKTTPDRRRSGAWENLGK
ncbi:unnamed protein product [Rotaria sp. Silwood1]|nr:unnamed protein product [Rotaria sp. Silwood1]